jgi:hypothetical protein
MSRFLLSTVAVAALVVTPVAAHHETPGKSHALATVAIKEPVKAGGKPLAPGTYEVWIIEERPNLTGTPSNAQRTVELRQNGKIIAMEVAEVFAEGERPTGTAGTADAPMARAAVQKLRGGEFVRIAINDGGARYLIHLPTADFSEPAPQPQAPSRVEVPPAVAPQPAPTQP